MVNDKMLEDVFTILFMCKDNENYLGCLGHSMGQVWIPYLEQLLLLLQLMA